MRTVSLDLRLRVLWPTPVATGRPRSRSSTTSWPNPLPCGAGAGRHGSEFGTSFNPTPRPRRRPRQDQTPHPALHGKVERSHRIDSRSSTCEGQVIDETNLFADISKVGGYYNYHPPHGALGGQTAPAMSSGGPSRSSTSRTAASLAAFLAQGGSPGVTLAGLDHATRPVNTDHLACPRDINRGASSRRLHVLDAARGGRGRNACRLKVAELAGQSLF
jgi:hypothetical protein